ncbi:MAG TPA: hypothetical protein DCM08_06535 [Microscillaceae bacterium]|jgi:hypothetical protein|nr:hypothetical protein [Microscillaceae bacterium]
MTFEPISKLCAVASLALILAACGGGNTQTTTQEGSNSVSVNNKGTQETKQNNAAADQAANTAKIEFSEQAFDFGEINEGDVVNHVFKFKNTGSSPLVIKDATASCGCTVPNWPKEPVAPGAEGEIKVEFNSTGKAGLNTKKVNVMANTNPEVTTVEIKVNVKRMDVTQGPIKQ